MRTLEFRFFIFLLWGIVTGCVTNTGSTDTFMGEGFRVTTLKPQTRAVVGGNQSVAVNKTVDWLNDHDLLVVDRWVAKELEEAKSGLDEDPQHKAYMLFVAHKVGAPLVVLVDVEKKPSGQIRNYSNTTKRPVTTIRVEINGLNAETGEIIFKGKAWNSKALLESKHLVQELTAFALHKALNAQLTPFPSTQKPFQESKDSEQLVVSPLPKQESSDEAMTLRSPEDQTSTLAVQSDKSPYLLNEEMRESSLPSQAQSTDSTITNPNPQLSQSDGLDESSLQSDSSVGLQIASGALSILYTPFKAAYAILGGFFGGLAYLVSGGNEAAANPVWNSSLGGTYWLTPQHLRGDEPINFLGPSNASP